MTDVIPKYILYQQTHGLNFPTKRRSFSDNSQKKSHLMLCKKHTKYKIIQKDEKNEQWYTQHIQKRRVMIMSNKVEFRAESIRKNIER